MLFLVFFLRNRLKVIINSVDIQDKNYDPQYYYQAHLSMHHLVFSHFK